MPEDWLELRSVNWTEGMFLTPDHFLHQERYVDSLVLWLARYALSLSGVIGSGARTPAAERGSPSLDPIVHIDESEDAVSVSVTQCRGITRGGAIVDIGPSRPVSLRVPKASLEGVSEIGIYAVARPHEKEPADDTEDPVNPGLRMGRAAKYVLAWDVPAHDIEWSLLLTRLRRAARGGRFEAVPGFIPPCVFLSSHSGLMHAYRQMNDRTAAIADRYTRLHRALVDFIAIARTRMDVTQDIETLEFVSRMVLTVEACAHEIADSNQPPQRFFQHVKRLIRDAALFLSLSPPTQEYFRLLADVGEIEFVSMLQQEGQALWMDRQAPVNENLQVEVQQVLRAFDRLERLEQALEGKYLDFRVSPSLEALNFVFDRSAGDPVLYKSIAKPARPQSSGQELTFVFAPLRLETRDREQYRLILVGDPQASFAPGDRVSVELRTNPGGGYAHRPDYRTAEYELDGQRNFAVDFKAPDDVATINDLRVSLQSSQPIRSAMPYVRSRLLPGAGAGVPPAPPMPRHAQAVGDRPPRPIEPVTPALASRSARVDDESPTGERQIPGARRPRLS